MNSDERKQVYDRREVALDEKLRKLDLSVMNLVPPDVGICDPPLRVYPLNNEWAKIVIGLVSWLATIAPWRDAEDEDYVGIQEVLTFMIGCDPCAAMVQCLQGIIDTPYEELSDELRQLLEALKQIQKTEGSTSYPILYNDNPALIEGVPGCDLDHLYAATLGLVDFAYIAIMDVLQDIDAATSGLAKAADIISAVPVLGLLPFDEIVDMANEFFEDLYSNFLSSYSEPLRREYSCDLFCIAKDNCGLFFVQAFDYFAGRATLSIDTFDLEDVVEFLTQGVFSGVEYVHVAHALFFFVLAFGGNWGKYSADFLEKEVASKFNDSDPDWAIFCDECTWSYQWNWTAGHGNWELSDDFVVDYQGVYVPGTGWQTTWKNNGPNPGHSGGNDSTRAVCIAYPLNADTQITSVDLVYDLVNSGNWDGTGQDQEIHVRTPALVLAVKGAHGDPSGTDKHLSNSGNFTVTQDEIVITLRSGRWFQNADPGGEVTLRSIEIHGVGDNPFE